MNNKKRHYYGGGKNRNRQRFQSEKPSINKVYDSNGPSGRQRGNASTLYEKYTTLGRDASVSGDRVLSENLMQHAEHYLRIINAIQDQMQSAYKEHPQPHSSEEQHSSEDTNDQATNISSEETNEEIEEPREKPIMRRKTYPFARRRQNETSNVKVSESQASDTMTHISEAPEPKEPVSAQVITDKENTSAVVTEEPHEAKPKRAPRKRAAPKKPLADAEPINKSDS